MNSRITILRALSLITILLASCIDPYKPVEIRESSSYLVVDGNLDASQATCLVKLSRTIPMDETEVVHESNAVVTLEDESSLSFFLTEVAPGEYKATGLSINNGKRYRVRIRTENGEEYESRLVAVLNTPPIDSVTWGQTADGVSVYTNTHDPANKTRYYQWRFTETWYYRSKYYSVLKIVGDTVLLRSPEELKIYQCWKSDFSKEILVGSSDRLGADIISQFRVATVPFTSAKLMLKYSILLEQRAIEPEAYDYWLQLKKNTEELGTLFDPLPSTTLGNIRCLSEKKRIVLGYFSASTIEYKRIFIEGREIEFPDLNFFDTGYEGCYTKVIRFGEEFENLEPITFESEGRVTIGYRATVPYCIDCRLQGGTTERPDYWENLD